jgi:hypothetical protein
MSRHDESIYFIPDGCICRGDGLLGMTCPATEHARLKHVVLAEENAELRAKLVALESVADQALASMREATAREAVLRDALEELHAGVCGECPSLLNEDSGGDARLDAAIEAALASPSPEADALLAKARAFDALPESAKRSIDRQRQMEEIRKQLEAIQAAQEPRP